MSPSINLRALLAPGKHALSLGRVPEAVALIQAKPRLASSLIQLLWDDDPGVAQRAADVLERVSCKPSPALTRILANSKDALLGLLPEAQLKKLRWNLALTLGRLPLTIPDCRRAAAAFQTYLDDPSSIVKTAALQGLADLTRHNPTQLPAVIDSLRLHGRSGTPAMRARSRILLVQLEKPAKQSQKCEKTPKWRLRLLKNSIRNLDVRRGTTSVVP
jgi:HEAT repeat protein